MERMGHSLNLLSLRKKKKEWRGWESVRMGGSDNKGDGLASQPRRYRVPGQPMLNQHQVGGVSRSPDGLFAQQEREPTRGRPTVRGKGTYRGPSRGGTGHLGLTHTETQQGRLWTACGQGRVDGKNSQTTLATTSTTSIRQLLGATDAQTAHHATSNTAPAHQPLGSANAETTPARASAAAADRRRVTVQSPVKKQQLDGMSHRGGYSVTCAWRSGDNKKQGPACGSET